MKKLLLVLPVLLIFSNVSAQLLTYLNLEAGPQWSLIRVADPGNQFQRASVRSYITGVTLAQEILPDLSIATGIYYTPRMDGINMIDKRPHQSMWSSYNSIMIPLRAEYRIQPTEYPFSFTPRLGYMYGRVNQPETPYTASSILSAPDGTAYNYSLDQVFESEHLHMLEVGIGLNLSVYGLWQASLNISYLSGFTDPLSTSLEYTADGTETSTAVYSSRGNSLQTTLAFNIPFSNIWQNKDYRIRSRIEGSIYKGKPTDRKGEFYAGAELGSLWRLFSATSPAIGARPMEDRGMFRYANLHTGAYVGYMLGNELGIDLGAYYQGSSTFYAIMYDHTVNFVTKASAPLFIEIPLRVRYLYYVGKRVYAGIYGGASLLTSISGGSFATGGGDFFYNTPASSSPVDGTTAYEASRVNQFVPLLRMGAGAEYRLPMEFPLIATLYVNYMHGFSSTDQVLVTNDLPEEIPASSSITYNGSGWSLDIGVKFPFSFGEKGICRELPTRE